ncbi:MAG: branched-chain amino acid ABC transporter permease [Firmicutes bacterium]|nr:branched-chain amino acid ABC transporter permease [Bacillota bacterium]MCL5038261.1 branched-chain amino acid ABC transporter permease [Bacillota bacterium]
MDLLLEIAQQVINGLVIGGIYTLMALGMTMIFGILDQTNFAHGELYMLGAYAAFFFSMVLGIPYLVSVCLAILVGVLLGLMYEWLIFRPVRGKDPLNAVIASLGASIFIWNAALLVFGGAPREIPTPFLGEKVNLLGVSLNVQRLLALAVTIGIILALYWWIGKSRLGRAMRATAQNREVAALMGIKIGRVAELVFATGGALAALGGALVGPIFLLQPSMGLLAVGKAFIVVIVGGMGSVLGAIYTGFGLGVLESLTVGFLSSAYRDVISFAILILVLWVRPQGLFGRTGERGG